MLSVFVFSVQEPTKGYHWSQRDKGTQAGPRRQPPYSPTASPRMDAATDDGRGGGAHPWYTHGHQPPPYGMQPPPSPHRGRSPSYGGAVAYIHAEYDRNGNSRQYDRYGDDYGSPPPPVARRPSYMAESPRCCLIPVPCAVPGPVHQPYPYDAPPPPPPPPAVPDYGPPAPGCCMPGADPYGREPEMYYGNGLYDRDPYYQGPIAERHVGSRSPGVRPQMVSNKKVQADLEDDGNGNVLGGGGGTSVYGGDGSTTGRTDLTEVALQRHLRQQQGLSPQKPGGGGVRQWLQEGGPRAATVDHGTGMEGMGVSSVPPAMPYGVEQQQQQAAPRQSQRWAPHASVGTDMAPSPVSSSPQQPQLQQQQQLMQRGPVQGQGQVPSVWDEGFAAPPPRVQPQAPRHAVVLALPEQQQQMVQQQMLQPRQSAAFAPRQSMAAVKDAAADAHEGQDHDQYGNADAETAWERQQQQQQQPKRSSMAQARRDSVVGPAEPARPRRAGSGSEQEDQVHTAGRASRAGSRAVTPSRLRNSSRQEETSPSQQQDGRIPRSSLPPRRRVSYKDPVHRAYDDEAEDDEEEEGSEERSDQEGRSRVCVRGAGGGRGRGAAADEYDVPGVEVDDVYVQELLQVVNGMLADMATHGSAAGAAARHSPRQAGGRRQGSASKSPAKRRVTLAPQHQQHDLEDQRVHCTSTPRASIAATTAAPAELPASARPSVLAPAAAAPQEVVDPSPVTAAEAAAAAAAGLSGILEIGRDVEEATRAALGRLASHSSPAGIATTPRSGGTNASVGFAGVAPEPLAPGGWASLGVDASPARSGSRVTLSSNGGGADANPDAYAARQRQASYLEHVASARSSVAVGGPYPHSMYGSPYGTSDTAPAPGGLPSVHTQLSGGHRYVAFDNPLASLAEEGSGGAVRSVAGAPLSGGGGTRTSPLLSDVLFSSLAPDLAWEVASALGGVGNVDEYGNGGGDGGQQQAAEAAAAKRLALPSMGYGATTGEDVRKSGMFAPVARKSSTVVNLNASPARAGGGGGSGEEDREAGGEGGAYGRPRESSAVTLSDKLRSLAALASDAAVRLHTFAPRLGAGASQADGSKHADHSTANALSQVRH